MDCLCLKNALVWTMCFVATLTVTDVSSNAHERRTKGWLTGREGAAVDWKSFIRRAVLSLHVEEGVWNSLEALDAKQVQAPGKVRRYEQSFGVEELLPHLCDPTGSKTCRGKGWGKGQERWASGLWPKEEAPHKIKWGTSLLDQWLRIRPPMQGTQVRSLVLEDPTCHEQLSLYT